MPTARVPGPLLLAAFALGCTTAAEAPADAALSDRADGAGPIVDAGRDGSLDSASDATDAALGTDATAEARVDTDGDGAPHDGSHATDGGREGGPLPALPPEVVALPDLDPGTPDEVYRSLDPIIGDARFVGLGETVHTVGGYYRAKARVIEYLVRTRGFRAVGFETPWLGSAPLSEYLDSCRTTPTTTARAAVVAGLFDVWQGEEVATLFEWLCRWNSEHPTDAVVFYGFDAQEPYPRLVELRRAMEPRAFEPLRAHLESLSSCHGTAGPFDSSEDADMDATEHRACLDALDAIEEWLRTNSDLVRTTLGERGQTLASLYVTGLRSWENQMWSSPFGLTGGDPNLVLSFEARDRAMATQVVRLADLYAPGKRVALWAHNTHLAHNQHLIDGYYRGARACGTFLASELGAGYVAIALTANEVTVNWPGLHVGPYPRDYPDSLEDRLAAFERDVLLVDTRPRGALFPDDAEVLLGDEGLVPRVQFAGILFLERAEGMTYITR